MKVVARKLATLKPHLLSIASWPFPQTQTGELMHLKNSLRKRAPIPATPMDAVSEILPSALLRAAENDPRYAGADNAVALPRRSVDCPSPPSLRRHFGKDL